uniref:Uncharacterized protein n=1 Tax=Brugia malayi TaxID=6279 RepID=A8NMY0_BRUMA
MDDEKKTKQTVLLLLCKHSQLHLISVLCLSVMLCIYLYNSQWKTKKCKHFSFLLLIKIITDFPFFFFFLE